MKYEKFFPNVSKNKTKYPVRDKMRNHFVWYIARITLESLHSSTQKLHIITYEFTIFKIVKISSLLCKLELMTEITCITYYTPGPQRTISALDKRQNSFCCTFWRAIYNYVLCSECEMSKEFAVSDSTYFTQFFS